jgi:hypothetical protein
MHAIDNGNGSDLGSVDGSGKFVTDGGDGSYRKELGSTQSGTIYSICGASGKLGNWSGGYSDTVNPVPHPVFVVNLRAMGSMIINVDGNILNAQYLDDQNVVRDDFTIVKPASGSVQVAAVSEIAPVGTSVATVNASGSGTLDYSIIGDNEAAMFAIDSSTGEVTSLALFDFQMDKIYNLTIGVTDDGVAIDPVLVTVNVLSMGDSDMRTTLIDLSEQVAELSQRPTQVAYDAAVVTARTAGQADVKDNPSNYNLTTSGGVTQTLNLKAGWNLVSFYVEADDMTPATVFAPIQDKLLQVKNLTQSYDPSNPPFLNMLSSLNMKDGYWLNVSEDVSLDVEGKVGTVTDSVLRRTIVQTQPDHSPE